MKKSPLILLPLAATACGQQAKDAPRPNIVLIMADDMGYSDLGCMGSEIRTPNLDALASQGVLMTNFCNASKSCPSRTALMTGMYQWKAGMGDMSNTRSEYPEYQGYLNDECMTLGELAKTAGYTTYMSGKWHVGDDEPCWPERRGFDHTFQIPNGGGVYFYPSRFGKQVDRVLYRDGVEAEIASGWYSTDGFGDEAVKFIGREENKTKPFFLYVPFIAPHYPLQAKEEDIQKYLGVYDAGYEAIREARFARQKELGVLQGNFPLSEPAHPAWETVENKEREARRMAVYAAQIDCLDQNVGKIISALKENGLYENTVVIFLSDNGAVMNHFDKTPDVEYGSEWCWASMGKWQNVSNTPFREGKGREFEGGIKTPLIFSWPAGLEEKGVKRFEYAHIMDIFPTFMELTGAKYPEKYNGKILKPLDGYSILPIIRGESVRRDRTLFFEHEGWKGLREGDWKVACRKRSDHWELYNLANDPYENVDLSAEDPERTAQMAAVWDSMAADLGVRPWPLDR